MLEDKYALFTKDDRVETICKMLIENQSPFIKEANIYRNHQDKLKVKLTDMLGGIKFYDIEITLITPTLGNWLYVVELTSTEVEVK